MSQVVIVPGFAVEKYMSGPADAVRARGLEVEVAPAPGSPRPGGYPDVAVAGAALAARVGDAPVVLVGHSFGCHVVLHAAAALGTSLRGVLLVGPTVAPALRGAGRLLLSWLADMPQESPRLALEQAPDWLRAGPRRLVSTYRSTLVDRPEDVIRTVRTPVVVARGERDTVCPHGWAADLVAACGGRLVTVRRGPHSWPYERPEVFADVVAAVYDASVYDARVHRATPAAAPSAPGVHGGEFPSGGTG